MFSFLSRYSRKELMRYGLIGSIYLGIGSQIRNVQQYSLNLEAGLLALALPLPPSAIPPTPPAFPFPSTHRYLVPTSPQDQDQDQAESLDSDQHSFFSPSSSPKREKKLPILPKETREERTERIVSLIEDRATRALAINYTLLFAWPILVVPPLADVFLSLEQNPHKNSERFSSVYHELLQTHPRPWKLNYKEEIDRLATIRPRVQLVEDPSLQFIEDSPTSKPATTPSLSSPPSLFSSLFSSSDKTYQLWLDTQKDGSDVITVRLPDRPRMLRLKFQPNGSVLPLK